MLKLITIGGYGFTEALFLEALQAANVDTFVDIRQRRGMRGSRYTFLNSERLQGLLARASIRYFHAKALAPTTEVRAVQKKADQDQDVGKQTRSHLAREFVEAYERDILAKFNANSFAALIGDNASVVAFFCVEGHPKACHRSLVAKHYASALHLPCEDLVLPSFSART